MSLQSEATMTSEEESLEEAVLELMKGTGFLADVKGQIARFIAENGKIGGDSFIVPDRASEQALSYIYEYLQWIGMKQTCSVLLSESPFKVDTSATIGLQNSYSDYRPKLHTLLKNQPSELDSKFLSYRKSEEQIIPVSKSSSTFMYKTPSARSFDDLLMDAKDCPTSFIKNNSVDDSFLTSTPAAADATFVKNETTKNDIDSSLLMGFNTPVSEGAKSQSNQNRSSIVPEKLFQKEDPFQALLRKHEKDDDDDLVIKPKNTTVLETEPIPSAKGELTKAQISKSVEQFVQEEERLRALQEQEEDLRKTEDEVMQSSMSTDWSEEGPQKPDDEDDADNGVNQENSNDVNVGNDTDIDRSKLYEFSDEFEEDKDSSFSNNVENEVLNVVNAEGLEINNADKNEVSTDLHSKSQNSDSDAKKSHLSNGHTESLDENVGDNAKENKAPPKKSNASGEVEDISISDLSIDMEVDDEDTKDVSIPSDTQGMSSCDHVVSIN